MTQKRSDEELTLFSRLFKGYEEAHGKYEITHTETGGKVLGRAVTYTRAASSEDYHNHLLGKVGIGIIPLLKNDKCYFGAIDIDIKGDTKLSESLEDLEKKVRLLNMPLMLFRSKSGGAHLYLFAKEPISARLVQKRLSEFADELGYGGCEVFPKQVTRLRTIDAGNWINIPLFGEERYAIYEGNKLNTKTALKTCEFLSVTEEQLIGFKIERNDFFADGPPCLQTIVRMGIGEGSRNNILMAVAVYMKYKHGDDWQENLIAFNEEYVDPPEDSSKLSDIIKRLAGKDYNYSCKTSPLCNHCDRKKCTKREFGVSFASESEIDKNYILPITGLTKYIAGDRESYRWGVSTPEAMLEFSTEELLSLEAHRRKFAELMNIILPAIKAKDFADQLQALMKNCTIVYDPEDASETGELVANIESWFTDKGGARNVDEMMKRIWWQNPENEWVFFIGAHLIDYLTHQKKMRQINRHKFWRLLEQRFKAEKSKLLIKGKRRNVYVIKDPYFMEDKAPLEIPDIQRKESEI